MRTIDIQVKRVSKGGDLQHAHLISRQATHFQQFERDGINIEFEDGSPLSDLQRVDCSLQSLFRLNKGTKLEL